MEQQYEHIVKVSKIVVDGLRRWWSSSWSNSISKQARDLGFFGLDSLGINELRTHDDPVRTRWHDQENRPRRSEEVVELFME